MLVLTDGHTLPLLLVNLEMTIKLLSFAPEYMLTIIDDEGNVRYLRDFDLDVIDNQYFRHGLPHDGRCSASEFI